MEYLKNINDDLKNIDETNIKYLNLFDHPEVFYGNLNLSPSKLNFSKFPNNFENEIKQYDAATIHDWKNMYNNSSGNRLRFSTSSNRIIFKIRLKRKWPYVKLLNWNAMGFDVYLMDKGKYINKEVFAPQDGYDTFAEHLIIKPNSKLCVFLPTYDVIEEMYIGIEKDATITKVDYPKNKQLPIIFYGNSITQGAAASKSGNIFPNVVSRRLNRDIINLSCSSCCRGNQSIAELIGKLNCHSIIIDYTRNASSAKELENTYEKFYQRIRDFHPDKQIILMTSSCFNLWRDYDEFDEVIIKAYENAIDAGDNTKLLHQRNIFNQNEYDYVAIDTSHYTDYGMFRIADEIIKLLQ